MENASSVSGRDATAERLEAATREIEVQAGRETDEAEFFAAVLDQLSSATGATAGIAWALDGNGLFGAVCERNVHALAIEQDGVAWKRNVQLLLRALHNTDPVQFHSSTHTELPLPTSHDVLLVTFSVQAAPAGMVQLFLPPDSWQPESVAQQQLEEVSAHIARFLNWRQRALSTESSLAFAEQLHEFTLQLQAQLSPDHVAAVAATECRRILDCDRVMLLVRRGARARCQAVSGQAHVQRRSRLVRALERTASRVLRTGKPVCWTVSMDLPETAGTPLREYVSEGDIRAVQLIPLYSGPQQPGDKRRAEATGVLVVEQLQQGWLDPPEITRANRLARAIGPSLANAEQHASVLFGTVRRQLGTGLRWLRGARLVLALLVAGLLTATAAGMCLVQRPFHVEARGRLMPAIRSRLFAPVDAEVARLNVISGQWVEQDTLLVELRNDELDAHFLSLKHRREQSAQRLRALQAEFDNLGAQPYRPDYPIRLQGQLAQLRAEIAGLDEQFRVVAAQRDALEVRAPVSGRVVTFHLEQRLASRPVRRGELLVEVMDDNGPWRLELELPERRMGPVLDGMKASASGILPVEYVLLTVPGQTWQGELFEVATRTRVSESEGTIVDVTVAIDDPPEPRRIGAVVSARIQAGERSVAGVLFGDLVEFAQRRWWW